MRPPYPGPNALARRLAGALTALCLGAALAAVPAPSAHAEQRSVAGLHLLPEGMGIELEREAGGDSWLAGAYLAPPGLYGGLRRYASTRPVDRAFWSVYAALSAESGPLRPDTAEASFWVSMGYEVRLDARVRGTGEVGFGLRTRRGGLWPAVFIGLGLGWKLPL